MSIYVTHQPNAYFTFRYATYRVCTYPTLDGRWAGFVEDDDQRADIAPVDTRRAAILTGLRHMIELSFSWLDELGSAMVCIDCYMAHHYGATKNAREATDAEAARYLCGHDDRSLMGLEFAETDAGLQVTEWFAGESDQRCEGGEPLRLLPDDREVTDWTYDYSDPEYSMEVDRYGDGQRDFSWSSCDGCGSHLGGSRHRLAIHPQRQETNA